MYYLELLEIVCLRLIIDVKEGEFPKKKRERILAILLFQNHLKKEGFKCDLINVESHV
jgi:hypothetical protein